MTLTYFSQILFIFNFYPPEKLTFSRCTPLIRRKSYAPAYYSIVVWFLFYFAMQINVLPDYACMILCLRVFYIDFICLHVCSERRLVAMVPVVRVQFQVRQGTTETDQSVQQPGAAQRRQTVSGIHGA